MPEGATPDAGLSFVEIDAWLRVLGPNAVPEQADVPSCSSGSAGSGVGAVDLEAAPVLEVVLSRYTQGGIIAALLLLNATVSFAQEGRARNAIALLRSKLEVHRQHNPSSR